MNKEQVELLPCLGKKGSGHIEVEFTVEIEVPEWQKVR